jgi:hypothetical protein
MRFNILSKDMISIEPFRLVTRISFSWEGAVKDCNADGDVDNMEDDEAKFVGVDILVYMTTTFYVFFSFINVFSFLGKLHNTSIFVQFD